MDVFKETHKFIHAADYIIGLISGEFENTDFSNAVKTGYDLANEKWPHEIERVLGIAEKKLPGVVRTGEITGELKADIRRSLGLQDPVQVVAGATDSTTGFIDMRACNPLHLYKGIMEGLAFVERMIYEKIEKLGYPVGEKVFSMAEARRAQPG